MRPERVVSVYSLSDRRANLIISPKSLLSLITASRAAFIDAVVGASRLMSSCLFSQKAYVFTFLLSARLFIPPSELLSRVCELCIKQQQLDQSPLDTVSAAPDIFTLLFVSDAVKEQGISRAVISLKHFYLPTNRLRYASLVLRSCSCWQNGRKRSHQTSGTRRWLVTLKTSSTG